MNMQDRIHQFHVTRARKQAHIVPVDVTLVIKVGVDKTFKRTNYRLNPITNKVEQTVVVVREHVPSVVTALDASGKKVVDFTNIIDTNRFHVVAIKYA